MVSSFCLKNYILKGEEMKLKALMAAGKEVVVRKAPEILSGVGIAGMLTGVVFAITATPKALKLIEEKKEAEKRNILTKTEVVQTTWKCYIPTIVSVVVSAGLIITANSIHNKRMAALAAAYTISDTAFKTYKNKIVETIGEKKEKDIRDAINQDEVNNDKENFMVIDTGKGDTLFKDKLSGRYFRSSVTAVDNAINEFNDELNTTYELFTPLNSLYAYLGLPDIVLGRDNGYSSSKDGLLRKIDDGSWITAPNGEPCKVLEFYTEPRYRDPKKRDYEC